MLGNSHERLTVSPARAARTRSAAILTSRFSRAARRMRSDSTGSPKLSHHFASGWSSDSEAVANRPGTSTEALVTGAVHPARANATAAASAPARTRADMPYGRPANAPAPMYLHASARKAGRGKLRFTLGKEGISNIRFNRIMVAR